MKKISSLLVFGLLLIQGAYASNCYYFEKGEAYYSGADRPHTYEKCSERSRAYPDTYYLFETAIDNEQINYILMAGQTVEVVMGNYFSGGICYYLENSSYVRSNLKQHTLLGCTQKSELFPDTPYLYEHESEGKITRYHLIAGRILRRSNTQSCTPFLEKLVKELRVCPFSGGLVSAREPECVRPVIKDFLNTAPEKCFDEGVSICKRECPEGWPRGSVTDACFAACETE